MKEKAKQFHQRCRNGCWLIVIVQLISLFLRWASLPDRIPAHFDVAGKVDRWGSKAELLVLPWISILMMAGLEWVSRHPKLWNIPVAVTEHNREALEAVTLRILSLAELLVVLLSALLEYFSMTGRSLPVGLILGFVLSVAVGICAAIFWCVHTAKKYR